MRTASAKVNKSLDKEIKGVFCQLLADMKDSKDIDIFLSSIFTNSEYETYSKRLAIAYWLKKGRSYANIKNNLKVSSATIASVSNSLNKRGIKEALKKIEADEWATQWSDRIKKFLPN